MIKFDIMREDMGKHIILESIGPNRHLIDKMKHNEDGTYDVTLIVGGVELDFNLFAKVVDEQLATLIEKRAQQILDNKYSDLIDEIDDMQKRIRYHEDKFKYSWEDLK